MCPRPTDIIKDMVDLSIEKALKGASPEAVTLPYQSIDEYKQVTGRRFRRTKDQMNRNLSQEDAFNEHLEGVRKDLLEALHIDEE